MASDGTANAPHPLHSEEIVLLPSVPLHDPIRQATASRANRSFEVDISHAGGRSPPLKRSPR